MNTSSSKEVAVLDKSKVSKKDEEFEYDEESYYEEGEAVQADGENKNTNENLIEKQQQYRTQDKSSLNK